VLTRLPPSLRLSGRAAWDYLTRRFEWPPFVLPADAHNGLLEGAAAEGIVGGAVYDALVGATAREAGATLLTLDRRATTTYEVVGVDFRFAG
jgi:predicted nucleic acid-binding protein